MQKREPLRPAGEEQYPVLGHPVAAGHRGERGIVVGSAGVTPQVWQPGGQSARKPGRRLPVPHIDGEVEHARCGGLVTVVARTRSHTLLAHH